MMEVSLQFFRFSVIGVMNTVVGYGAYYLLLYLNVNYMLAAAISTVIGILNSFLWNKVWVFRATGSSLAEVIKFSAVYIGGLVINLLFLPVLVEGLHIDPRIAQLFFLLILPFLTFFGLKYWSFK